MASRRQSVAHMQLTNGTTSRVVGQLTPFTWFTYYDIHGDVEIHRSARTHGIDDTVIRHALDHAITIIDLEPEADPPKVLAIGPDRAGNLLEII